MILIYITVQTLTVNDILLLYSRPKEIKKILHPGTNARPISGPAYYFK